MATIKISDLSVGDWVQDKNGVCVKVIGTENWSNGYFLNIELHGVNVGVTTLASARPIPITPEILEANGLVKNGEYNEWNIETRSTPSSLGVSLEIKIWWNGSSIFIDQVKYVHQLQHALRLAGVDKEIVIPKK